MQALREAARLTASHPLVGWLLAATFIALGAGHVLSDRFLNDEGLLAYYFAGMLWDSPFDVVFWQKSRPLLALFYAPATAAGLSTFLVAHVIVAGLAGPLAASVARCWGHRYPNLAAVFVLASPLLVAGGPAGVSNTDAVTLAVLALWLSARGWQLPAGMVLGSMFFVRAELTLLVVALASLAVFERRFRLMLVGVVAFPAVYWLLGIIYHHDFLWILHYPPALMSRNPGNVLFEQMATPPSPWAILPAALALTPAVGIAALVGWRKVPLLERVGMLFAIGYLVVIRLLPYFGAFNFGSSPRYLLPALPFLALMASRTFSLWHDLGDRWWSLVWLAGLLVVALLADTWLESSWVLISVAALSALVALARLRRVGLAAALTAIAAVAPVPWLLPATELAISDVRRELAPAVAWLAANPDVVRAGPVLTNMHLLATYARRTGALQGLDVRQLVQADQLVELTQLTNPHVGQRDRIMALLERHFYAKPVFPEALRPESLPHGTVFVLSDDGRMESVMPMEEWGSRLEVLVKADGWRVAASRATP